MRKLVAQLWSITIWGRFLSKLCFACHVHFAKNCGRSLSCGGQNQKIMFMVVVGIVIFGKKCAGVLVGIIIFGKYVL